MIKIILADDHQLVRKAFRLLLEAEGGFHVMAEAADGAEAISLVEKHSPDVLVLDLAIPRVHGLDVIRHVAQHSKTAVLVVSMHTAPAYVNEAMNTGAKGYVPKHSLPEILIHGVREVVAGRTYLSPEIQPIDPLRTIKIPRLDGRAVDPLTRLTRREKIILQLAAEGNNNTQIGRQLSLSPRTVESHRASLMMKLSLRSQTDLVRFAIRKNLISC